MSRQTSLPLWRRITARALVVLGVLLAAVTILAGYLRWQAFDNDTFSETASELIANDSVRDEVAATMVDQLFSNVDVSAALEERLPPDQQRLAGPASAGLRAIADRLAVELLERPRVQALWRQSVSAAHGQLVDLLRGDTTVVKVQDAAVVLDLRPLVVQLGERLAIIPDLSERLPEDAGVIRVMDADQLERAQDATNLFETIAAWVWVLPFLLWGIAIWLVPGRRRIELRAVALGILVASLLVLVLRSVAGGYVVDALATTTTVHDAGEQAWGIVTDLLSDGAWAAFTIGLVALIGVWLAGDTGSGRGARRWLTPVFAQPGLTYGILAVLLLLFIWWGPFAQARRPLYVFVTTILLVIGIEVLRRAAVREFPDAAQAEARELLRPLRRPRGGRAPAAQSAAMAELEQAARLHEQGVLSDDELAAVKARVLRF